MARPLRWLVTPMCGPCAASPRVFDQTLSMTDPEQHAPSRSRRRAAARRLVRLSLIAYLLYAVAVFFLQRFLVFPGTSIDAPRAQPPQGTIVHWIDDEDGQVEAWLVPPSDGVLEGAPAVVFVHGNGELIDHFVAMSTPARAMGYAVLLVEYPGYGRSEGSPSRRSLLRTHEQAYDWLVGRGDVDAERIVIFGRSMGGAVACELATRRPSAALVVMSSFTRLSAFSWQFALPPFLVRDRFACERDIATYPGPALLLHGEHDALVPVEHGRALADAAPNATFVPMDCAHNDCPDDLLGVWQHIDALVRDGAVE